MYCMNSIPVRRESVTLFVVQVDPISPRPPQSEFCAVYSVPPRVESRPSFVYSLLSVWSSLPELLTWVASLTSKWTVSETQ